MFQSVDPKAEKYPGWSSYNYTLNNPLNLTDFGGEDPRLPEPNAIPILISREKSYGKSRGTFGQIGAYYSIFVKPDVKGLIEQAKRIKTMENIVNLAGEYEHPVAPLVKEVASIPIANEKGKLLEQAAKIDLLNKERQQLQDRAVEATRLVDNLDIANQTGVFGEELSESNVIDLTNYIMISKYGNTDILTYDFYKPLLKGGNSDKYLSHLKNLAEKYKADYHANRQRRVNLNKLDGPPIEISIEASKYQD